MKTLTKKIVPLECKASYLEARKIAAERGLKLPSNVLHDDYLVGSDRWKEVRGIYTAWALEILVYPEIDGSFQKGKDIVDSKTGWVVPAKYVPEEAVGRKGVGLFLVPGDVEEKGKVVIHPAGEPIILTPFIQENCGAGKVDNATRVPLAISDELFDQLSKDEKRWLYRIAGIGVRPLARYDGYDGGRGVGGGHDPDDSGHGVAVEAPESGIFLIDNDANMVRSLCEASSNEIEELLSVISPEKLHATQKLLAVLKERG